MYFDAMSAGPSWCSLDLDTRQRSVGLGLDFIGLPEFRDAPNSGIYLWVPGCTAMLEFAVCWVPDSHKSWIFQYFVWFPRCTNLENLQHLELPHAQACSNLSMLMFHTHQNPRMHKKLEHLELMTCDTRPLWPVSWPGWRSKENLPERPPVTCFWKRSVCFFRSALAWLFKMLPVKEEAGQKQPSRCQHDIVMELIRLEIRAALRYLSFSSIKGYFTCSSASMCLLKPPPPTEYTPRMPSSRNGFQNRLLLQTEHNSIRKSANWRICACIG